MQVKNVSVNLIGTPFETSRKASQRFSSCL